jgi:hypothetical protein
MVRVRILVRVKVRVRDTDLNLDKMSEVFEAVETIPVITLTLTLS